MTCRLQERTLDRKIRSLVVENELLRATFLPDKGTDIYALTYLPGEASTVPWDYEIVESGTGRIVVVFRTRPHRSPFQPEREVQLQSGETIHHYSPVSIEFMWGQHPSFGAPFLNPSCRIDINARHLLAEDRYTGSHNPLNPGKRYRWSSDGQEENEITAALSHMPDERTPQDLLACFEGFDEGWYGITNCDLGFEIGLVWPVELFPFAWYWRELRATPGYPWYKADYVMAIEPFTSIPGQGLEKVIETSGTQRILSPGQSMSCGLKAVFYESRHGIEKIESDGTVHLRGEVGKTR